MINRKYIRKGFAAALALTMVMSGMSAVNVSAVQEDLESSVSESVAELTNLSSVSSLNITKGQTLTINGSASGGSGEYTYAYFYKKASDSKWITKKNFSTSQSVSLTPVTVTTYNICVKVRDSDGSISKKYFDVTVGSALLNNSQVSSKSITKGQKITMIGAASGGSGGYTYAFLYKKASDANWVTKQNFSSNKSVSITPAYAATYNICIKVKDSNGAITKKYFDVAVKQLENNSSLSSTLIAKGDSVVLNGSASGGNGSYSYAYYAKKKEESSWKTLKGFTTTKSVSFTPAAIGEYDVCIKVKDVTGIITKQYMTLKVVNEINAAAEITESIINGSMTELQKVKAIHDWLVNNVEYDIEGYYSGRISEESYTAEGLFKNRKAVCDGYSKAFLQMAEYAGLDVIRVTGVAYNSSSSKGEGHSWNQVKVSGKWYNIDVTWDDPIITAGSVEDNLRYQYFLIPDSVIKKDHVFDNGIVKYNCTTAQPLDLFLDDVIAEELAKNTNWCYCENDNDLDTKLNAFIKKGITQFTVIYKTDETNSNKIMNTIFSHCQGIRSFSCSFIQWKFDGYYKIAVSVTV